MIDFWMPVLIVAALISLSLGLYVGLGRRTQTPGGNQTNNAPPGGNLPGGVGTVVPPATTTTNVTRAQVRVWQTRRFKFGAGVFVLTVVVIAAILLAPWAVEHYKQAMSVCQDSSCPSPSSLSGLLSMFNTPFWLFVGIVLILMSFILPKDLKRIAFGVGLGVLLLTFALSGFGQKAATEVTGFENCVAHSDCGPRSYDIPVINGGTVYIPQGGFKNFYAVGEVAIQNQIGYCLDVSPRGAFKLRETSDARIVYIHARSGRKELATVTSLPASECTK